MSETNETGPFVSVIVPVFNGADTIGDCLASLLRMDYPTSRIEILAVDNGSTDETSSIIRRYPVHHVWEGMRGAPHAMNRGIASSRGEIVAFTDADCVVTTGWVRELVGSFQDEQVWGVAGEVFPYPPSTPAERYMASRLPMWQEKELNSPRPFAITANVSYRRETFEQVGLFSADVGVAYDQDFSWRFLESGLQFKYNPSAAVFHRHRSTSWSLFRQQVGWGRAATLLHVKHDLPWTLRDELEKWQQLVTSFAGLARVCVAPREWQGDRRRLHRAYFEFVRTSGLRVGAVRGLINTERVRGRRPSGPIAADAPDPAVITPPSQTEDHP